MWQAARFLLLSVALAGSAGLSAQRVQAQEQRQFPSWSPGQAVAAERSPTLSVPISDSVRQKIGYHHWEGAAIGAGAGAVVGLLLSLGVRYSCSHCDPSTAGISVAGAGLGSAFGFVAGLASPKYRWVADTGGSAP